MQKNSLIFAALFAAICLVACDEGDITESTSVVGTSGKTASLTADISGLDTWSAQYSVVLAAFADGSSNALTQKSLPAGADGAVAMTLALTSDEVSTIELCVTNRLRERIVTFASVPVSEMRGDTVRLDAGQVDVGMFRSIQDLVFTTTCARCHGLGATPAGELTLVEGQSYDQLVGHQARLPENGTRVVPGSASTSLLHRVLRGDADAGVRFDHSNLIKETNTLTLIDNWINNGALQ